MVVKSESSDPLSSFPRPFRPMRPTSGAIPIATPGAPPASDFFSSPAMYSSPVKPFSSSPMKKSSLPGRVSFGNMDDLLGFGGAREVMSGAPMVPSRVDSTDDLFGAGGGGSSGPASSSTVGDGASAATPPAGHVHGPQQHGVAADDLLGALFSAAPSTSGASSAVSSSGGAGADRARGSPPTAVSPLSGSKDDFLGDLLSSSGGAGTPGLPPRSVPVPTEDASPPAAGATSVSEIDAGGGAGGGGGGREGEGSHETTIGAAVARAQERAAAHTPPTAAPPVIDGFAGFEDFVTSSSAGAAGANGAGVRGGVVGGGSLDSLEDLFHASTSGGGAASNAGGAGGVGGGGGGMSLGDDFDAMFSAPSPHANRGGAGAGASAVIIDDMFGPAMGAAFSGWGGAGVISSQVSANEIVYQPGSDDEEQEGDTPHRKELRRQRHQRNRDRIGGGAVSVSPIHFVYSLSTESPATHANTPHVPRSLSVDDVDNRLVPDSRQAAGEARPGGRGRCRAGRAAGAAGPHRGGH